METMKMCIKCAKAYESQVLPNTTFNRGILDFYNEGHIKNNCPICNGNLFELALDKNELEIVKKTSMSIDFILAMNDLKNRDIIEFNLKMSQFKQNILTQQNNNVNCPKCPTCGSTNVRKISSTKRWLSTGIFGLASSNVGKNMECLSCHSKW
jgi:predicted nucleic-acid-binding Zn-ribbon protein